MNAQDPSEPNEATPLMSKLDDEPDAQDWGSTATIYLVAAACATGGVSALATQYLLKDEFGVGPAGIAYYTSFHSIGWVIKPVWGFISDSYPICGQRRRPYLVIVAGVGALAFLAYGVIDNVLEFVLVLILTHACMSFMTVIAQALLCQRSGNQKIQAASFNFSSYFGLKIALSAVATLAAGFLLDHKPARQVLMLCAGAFVLVLLPVPFMREKYVPNVLSASEQCGLLAKLFSRKEVWGVTLYMFCFCSMPNPASAMFFFNVDVLGFSASFVAMIAVCSAIAQCLGLVVYHYFLTKVPFRWLFGIATTVCAVLCLTPLIQVWRINRRYGIDDHVFALVDTFVIMMIAEILWIPLIVLVSRLCPANIEGTAFAMFLSIHNLGFWVGGCISAVLMWHLEITRNDLSNLWVLIVICSMSMLFPLFLLPLVPIQDPEVLRDSAARIEATDA